MPRDKGPKIDPNKALEMGFTPEQMGGMGHLRRRFKEIAKAVRGNRQGNEITLPKSRSAYDDIYNPEREAAINEAAAFYPRKYDRIEAPEMYQDMDEQGMINRQPSAEEEAMDEEVSSQDLSASLQALSDPAPRIRQELLRRRMQK